MTKGVNLGRVKSNRIVLTEDTVCPICFESIKSLSGLTYCK